jgi:S1-C subfamily serine protease
VNLHIGRVILPLARTGPGGILNLIGTCFAVSPRRFVTAAHVSGPSDDGLSAIIGRVDSLADYQDPSDTSVTATSLKIVNYSPLHDIAILELIEPESRVAFGYSLGSTDMIVPGAPVLSLGYPHTDHGRLVLTQQSSMVGARVLLEAEGIKIKHVVLNTQTRPGQSGGPVFSADGFHVCAMIVGGYAPSGGGGISLGGVDPQTLHQTTHAISAEYIRELL